MTQLTSWQSPAQLVQEKLIFEKTRIEINVKSPLAQQKAAETQKKWPECSNLGQKNFAKENLLKGWVLQSWIRCAREGAELKKNISLVEKPLEALDKNNDLTLAGSWSSTLFQEGLKTRFLYLDILGNNKPELSWKHLEKLFANFERLDREQKARVYVKAAELAQARTKLKAAQSFLEQSLAEKETKSARDKLNSVLFALNQTPPPAETNKNEVEVEGGFGERFEMAGKANDLLGLMDHCVAYLNQYPNGKKAKWASDKILEIYQNFSDQPESDKITALKENALSIIEKADASRALEWARILHKKADFPASLRLSERALFNYERSKDGAVLLYMAGRSAHILADWPRALKYLQRYAEYHAGAEDINEVLFRTALTQIRMEQYSSAVTTLEKLLLQKNIDRYELSAHYWLVRALQLSKNAKADAEIELILNKYPFSYYGFRLRLEKNNNEIEWPTALKIDKKLQAEYNLSTEQKKIWDRATALAQNNWSAEALLEMNALPNPSDATTKALLAEHWSSGGVFPPAIKLVAEAGDLNPELRALQIVNFALPQVYKEAIQEQAQKQKLSPYLVKSLIRQESAFHFKAISTSNALGLMQMIPPTAQEIITDLSLNGVSVPHDVFNPPVNIQMGTYYLAKVLKQFSGYVPLGLAAYNAGPRRIQSFVRARPQIEQSSAEVLNDLWFDELPWFETSFYVKAILRNVILYKLVEKPDQRRVSFPPVLWSDLAQ